MMEEDKVQSALESAAKSINVGFFYDFDDTLTEEFQQYPIFRHFFKKLKKKHKLEKIEDYWKLCEQCDKGVGYMQQMLKDTPRVFSGLTNKMMEDVFAKDIKLSPGIPDWFPRINEFCKGTGINPEHHVISVGILPLIKGSAIYSYLNSVHSGEFHEDENNITKIKTIIEPFRKFEYLKRICKGADLYTDLSLDQYHINYFRTLTLGDGFTDRDILRFAHERGGIAIGVFEKGNRAAFERAQNNLGKSVNFIVPRDYTQGSVLERVTQESLYDIVHNGCDMDYILVHNFTKNQIRNKEVGEVVKRHLDSCGKCKKKLEPKFYFS